MTVTYLLTHLDFEDPTPSPQQPIVYIGAEKEGKVRVKRNSKKRLILLFSFSEGSLVLERCTCCDAISLNISNFLAISFQAKLWVYSVLMYQRYAGLQGTMASNHDALAI